MSIESLVKKEVRGPVRIPPTRLRLKMPPDAINLAPGDPNFLLPEYIADAVYKAIREGYTHYCFGGDPELKEAIACYYKKFGYEADPMKQVIITSGGSQSIFQAYAAILNPDDEVIAFDPSYGGGRSPLSYFGAKLVYSPMKKDAEGYFRIDIEALKEKITEKTKALYMENPGNPTGIVYTKEELEAIADLAKDHNFIVISDEIYTEFIWGGRKHIPIISLPDMEDRTIVIMAMTKMFAWAGMRTGWIISGPTLTSYINRVPAGITGVPWPIQKAAIVALNGPWDFVKGQAAEYEERIDYCVKRLNEMPNIKCVKPEGAFYLFPDISATGLKSAEFCAKLFEQEKLRIVPGSAYGPAVGEGHVRIALVRPLSTQTMPSWFKVEPDKTLEAAMDRLERFTKSLAK